MEVIKGTCTLCYQVMLQETKTLDTWHPWEVRLPCPPEPAPDDLAAWQVFYQRGLRPGRPGIQHFRPDVVEASTPYPPEPEADEFGVTHEKVDTDWQEIGKTQDGTPVYGRRQQ